MPHRWSESKPYINSRKQGRLWTWGPVQTETDWTEALCFSECKLRSHKTATGLLTEKCRRKQQASGEAKPVEHVPSIRRSDPPRESLAPVRPSPCMFSIAILSMHSFQCASKQEKWVIDGSNNVVQWHTATQTIKHSQRMHASSIYIPMFAAAS